jgi:hypothetical protein
VNAIKDQYETKLAHSKEELVSYKAKVKKLEDRVKGLEREGTKLKELVDS